MRLQRAVVGDMLVRHVARMGAALRLVAMLGIGRVEVAAGRLEAALRLADAVLVDVEADPHPFGQAARPELDQHAMRRIGQRGGAGVVAFGVDETGGRLHRPFCARLLRL